MTFSIFVTAGIVLNLVGIAWLQPLGIALLAFAAFFSSLPRKVLAGVLLLLFADLTVSSWLGCLAWRESCQQFFNGCPYEPSIASQFWHWVVFVAIWAISMAWQLWSWRRGRMSLDEKRVAKIDSLWLGICLVAWIPTAGSLMMQHGISLAHGVTPFMLFGLLFESLVDLFWGGIWVMYFVGIPLRILVNMLFRERRRQRLGETLMGLVTFLILSLSAFMAVNYPPP